MDELEKKILGLTEPVIIKGSKRSACVAAICDTGATRTSIDLELSEKIDLGVPTKVTHVKNPSVDKRFKRPVVNVCLRIGGEEFMVDASIQNRSHMTHKIIVGRDILFGNFMVDVSKTHTSNMLKDIRDKDVLAVKYIEKEGSQ